MHHTGPIAGIAAHGDLLATAGYDNAVILWDARQRKALSRGSHDHLVNHCSFSADGRWLVTASSDYSARVWSVPTLRLHAVLAEHDDDVDMAAFSPDGRFIATCALDRCVRIFDCDGRCLRTMHGHTGNVLSIAWRSDSRQVVSSSVDGTLRHWDVERGVEVQSTDLQVRTDSVEIDPNGVVYAGDDRGRIVMIDGVGTSMVQAHSAGIKKVALDVRRGAIVALSYDRTMSIWRTDGTPQLHEVRRTTCPAVIWARAAAILDDGRVAAGTFGGSYALFDPETDAWDLEGATPGDGVNAVLSVDRHIYTVGDAGVVRADGAPVAQMGSLCNFLVDVDGRLLTGGQLGRLFDARTGEVLYEHHSPLNCGVAFTRWGTPHVAVGTYTGEVLIFDGWQTGAPQRMASLAVYENAVKGLSCSGGLLFSVCASTEISWHDVDDWSLVKRVPRAHDKIANACCAIDDGRFASVARDRTLRIWHTDVSETYESPHANSVKCLGVNADRTRLLTGSYGGTVAMFDVPSRRWVSLERPTTAGISSITWDDRHQQFLAASYDGAVYTVHV